MKPAQILAGLAILLLMAASFYTAVRLSYQNGLSASELTHLQEMNTLRGEYQNRISTIETDFADELKRAEAENRDLEQNIKEFTDATANLTLPAGCGLPLDLVRQIDAIR